MDWNPTPETVWNVFKTIASIAPALTIGKFKLARTQQPDATLAADDAEVPDDAEILPGVAMDEVLAHAGPASEAPAAVEQGPPAQERKPAAYSSVKRSREEVWEPAEKRVRDDEKHPIASTSLALQEKHLALQQMPKPAFSKALKAEMETATHRIELSPADREFVIGKTGEKLGLGLTKQGIAKMRADIASIPAKMRELQELAQNATKIEEWMKWAEQMRALHK